MTALNHRQILRRAGALFILIAGGLALRVIDPTQLPFRPSCGAMLGLPCIFCGTTRGLHHLLNGEFARALYFNWIAFPVALAGLAACVLFALEIARRRRIILAPRAIPITPRIVAAACVGLFVIWSVQVALALKFQKHELLNPRGILYAVFVK